MNSFRLIQGILCMLLMLVPSALPEDFAFRESGEENLQVLAHRVHEKINAERHTRGLKVLNWNEKLAGEAKRHAANMAHRRFFSHMDPLRGDLSERLDTAGIAWNRCAENLYKEKGNRNPATSVVQAWLNSPGHRKNMLDLWMIEAGVGVAMGPDGVLHIVQTYMYPIY